MAYVPGDTLVHPRHGVVTVLGTSTRPESQGARDYVELFYAPQSLTIMVPVDSLDEVGIRALPTRSEAEEILAILGEPADVPTAWAERRAATRTRLQSAELIEASLVVRDLLRHAARSDKPLSAAENSTLGACLDSVSLQLSHALDSSQEETQALIERTVVGGGGGQTPTRSATS